MGGCQRCKLPAAVGLGRDPHDRLEIADEVRLIGVSELAGEVDSGQVRFFGEALGRFHQPVAAQHLLGANADFSVKEPLEGPKVVAQNAAGVFDPVERPVVDEASGTPSALARKPGFSRSPKRVRKSNPSVKVWLLLDHLAPFFPFGPQGFKGNSAVEKRLQRLLHPGEKASRVEFDSEDPAGARNFTDEGGPRDSVQPGSVGLHGKIEARMTEVGLAVDRPGG